MASGVMGHGFPAQKLSGVISVVEEGMAGGEAQIMVTGVWIWEEKGTAGEPVP